MCGIVAYINFSKNIKTSKTSKTSKTDEIIKCLQFIKHRGPDNIGTAYNKNSIIGHVRLAINNPNSGSQPFIHEKNNVILAVNGEIYNHKYLEKELATYVKDIKYELKYLSDCEVLLPLIHKYEHFAPKYIDGQFSFVYTDDYNFYISRDRFGIIPLYTAYDSYENLWVSSEVKAFPENCSLIKEITPGTVLTKDGLYIYYEPIWKNLIGTLEPNYEIIREIFTNSVKKTIMSDSDYGVLLSGGLDSSLVSSIVSTLHCKNKSKNLHSFSIGFNSSENNVLKDDLYYAKKVAEFIKSVHHSFTFNEQEAIESIEPVIYHLETYDITTIRASIPMFLLSKKIQEFNKNNSENINIKMLLSGEGSDEMFGGYLYMNYAPDTISFQKELVKLMNNIHYFDCNRANKSTMAHSLEVRVPFLDHEFVDHIMSINPSYKAYKIDKEPNEAKDAPIGNRYNSRNIEKYILRKAFEGYLPDSVLWRQKSAFSDVGHIPVLKNHADKLISDEILQKYLSEHNEYKSETNISFLKEEILYKQIYNKFYNKFPNPIPYYWRPNKNWINVLEPSATFLKVNEQFCE
jgi:asparagine synthase (glutamine-hydrolysing)